MADAAAAMSPCYCDRWRRCHLRAPQPPRLCRSMTRGAASRRPGWPGKRPPAAAGVRSRGCDRAAAPRPTLQRCPGILRRCCCGGAGARGAGAQRRHRRRRPRPTGATASPGERPHFRPSPTGHPTGCCRRSLARHCHPAAPGPRAGCSERRGSCPAARTTSRDCLNPTSMTRTRTRSRARRCGRRRAVTRPPGPIR